MALRSHSQIRTSCGGRLLSWHGGANVEVEIAGRTPTRRDSGSDVRVRSSQAVAVAVSVAFSVATTSLRLARTNTSAATAPTPSRTALMVNASV
jgi:hypothetical protein